MPAPAIDTPWLAIADPTRRAILDRLKNGQRNAGDLAAGFNISQPAVSQHLAVLLRTGLVARERRGREQMYSIKPGAMRDIAEWVAAYSKFWDAKLASLGTYLNTRRARPAGTSEVTTQHKERSP